MQFFEVPPFHDAWVVGDEAVSLLDIAGNSAGFGLPVPASRRVRTMLMSDIVGSTDAAARLGDAEWRSVLGAHDRAVRRQLDRFRGHEIKTTGDGFLATFDSAGAAVRCALAILDEARQPSVRHGELPQDRARPSVHRDALGAVTPMPPQLQRREREPEVQAAGEEARQQHAAETVAWIDQRGQQLHEQPQVEDDQRCVPRAA